MELINNGFHGKEYFKELFNNADRAYEELTRLTDEELEEYRTLLDRFEYINKNRNQMKNNKLEIGDILEEIVTFIFEKSSIFEVVENIRTPNNEIDQIVTLNSKGNFLKSHGYIDIKGDYLISECKNYNKTIGVTWVGKLFSLLNYTNTRLGILFSYHGLSGKGWNSATGLTKKLFLSKERAEDKIYIIDINMEHFRMILHGENFLDILKKEMLTLSTDTNIKEHIVNHELQMQIKSYI